MFLILTLLLYLPIYCILLFDVWTKSPEKVSFNYRAGIYSLVFWFNCTLIFQINLDYAYLINITNSFQENQLTLANFSWEYPFANRASLIR